MCIRIYITATQRTDSNWNTYSFYSDKIDGRYAEGSIGDRAYRLPTVESYKETAINQTLAYLGGNFKNVYGRDMTRNDICGEETYRTQEQEANDLAKAIAYELQQQQKAANDIADQLALKAGMLQSETVIWQSQDAYNIALADTNKAIDIFNNVTLPGFENKTALAEQFLKEQTLKTPTEPIKLFNGGFIIIGVFVIVILFFMLGRK